MGVVAILLNSYLTKQTVTICIHLNPPFDRRLHMKLKKIGPGVSGRRSFKGVDEWTTDEQWTDNTWTTDNR